MNRKLAQAIEAVAAAAVELIQDRVGKAHQTLAQMIAEGSFQPMYTVKQAPEYYNASTRTIYERMKRREPKPLCREVFH